MQIDNVFIMNEAFHVYIRLTLIFEKTFYKGTRPDLLAQLGLWIGIFWTIQSAIFVSGYFHKMPDIMMKCRLFTIMITTQTFCKGVEPCERAKMIKQYFCLCKKTWGTFFICWVYTLSSQVYANALLKSDVTRRDHVSVVMDPMNVGSRIVTFGL